MKKTILVIIWCMLGALVIGATPQQPVAGVAVQGPAPAPAPAMAVPAPRMIFWHDEDNDSDEDILFEAPAPPPAVGAFAGHGPMAFAFGGERGRPWLGVRLGDVTSDKAKELKLSGEYGVVVQGVEVDSPAAKAGLAENDVILECAGERVRSAAQLQRLVRETPPGRSVTLQVSRAGQTRTLNAKLEARRDHFRLPRIEVPHIEIPEFDVRVFSRGARLGITADELTSQLAAYFGVKQGKGVLVREVMAGTPAEKAGLKAGDVIVRIGEKDVHSMSDLHRALRGDSSEEKQEVTLTIVRERREQTLKVELEPARRSSPRRTADRIAIDPDELKGLAAEMRAHAAQMQAHARKVRQDFTEHARHMRRKVAVESRRMQKEARRLGQERRNLREQLRRHVRQMERVDHSGII